MFILRTCSVKFKAASTELKFTKCYFIVYTTVELIESTLFVKT